jgi:hypothetical protein
MYKKLILVVLPLLAFGCAGSPARVLLTGANKLQAVSSFDLCKAYFLRPAAKLELELKKRHEFTPKEWAFIEQQKIYIGMREVALVCGWGRPGLFGSISESASQAGIRKQWVYRACPACKALYVYTENGKVTGWKNLKTRR